MFEIGDIKDEPTDGCILRGDFRFAPEQGAEWKSLAFKIRAQARNEKLSADYDDNNPRSNEGIFDRSKKNERATDEDFVNKWVCDAPEDGLLFPKSGEHSVNIVRKRKDDEKR